MVVLPPEGMVPPVGLSESQDCVGAPADQEPPPPELLSVMDCEDGLIPTVVVNESTLGSICIEKLETLIVIATAAGLPLTVLPVRGSVAVTVTVAL